MARKRVLYAEDDFLNGKLLEILLRKAGVECDIVCDGAAAVERFGAGIYGAVIVDAYLPGLNGEAVAGAIRRKDGEVPLVAITSDSTGMERLKQAGFDRVFLKPLRGREWLIYLLGVL